MQIITVNNIDYAVYIHQRDENLPWLLMLHGFMGDHRVFDHLVEELSKICNPVAIDLLGHGQSTTSADPKRYREERQTDDLRTLINKLNIAPVLLYGYSMGGRLALKTAVKYPDLFSGLILEGTTNGIIDKADRTQRKQLDKQRALAIESNYDGFLAQWEEADLFQSPRAADRQLKEKYHRIHLEQSPEAMAASLRGFGTGFMRPEIERIPNFDKPVLLTAGSGDSKYQAINQHLVKLFPHATFVPVEAGHRVHLDNPSAFLENIKSFILGLH